MLAEQRIQLQVFPGRDPILVTDPNTVGEGGSRAVSGGAKKKRRREQLGGALLAELGPNGLPNEGEAVWGKVKGQPSKASTLEGAEFFVMMHCRQKETFLKDLTSFILRGYELRFAGIRSKARK